jgi:hypothetical protein
LSFDQVAQIIGDTLPPFATTHREWWANQEGGSRAPYWRAAGFRVDDADLKLRIVQFRRPTPVKELPRALTLARNAVLLRREKRRQELCFHIGGLSELQFNLGFEDVGAVTTFRHGIAFSLQTTRDLPAIDLLVPKIARFNEYLHIYPEAFAGFEMWNWSDGSRSDNYPVAPIPDSQVKEQTFIFIGRLQPANAIHVGMILDDFDRLLPLYEFVEGTATFPAQAPARHRMGFV